MTAMSPVFDYGDDRDDRRLAAVAAAIASADGPHDARVRELVEHCRTVRSPAHAHDHDIANLTAISMQALAVAQASARRCDALEAARGAAEERAADMVDAWRRAAREGAGAREAAVALQGDVSALQGENLALAGEVSQMVRACVCVCVCVCGLCLCLQL
jgi:hypothetical protein